MSAKNRHRRLRNRIAKQAAASMRVGEVQPGSVYTLDVRHDDWCDQLNGKGECNCNPIIEKPKRVVMPEDN